MTEALQRFQRQNVVPPGGEYFWYHEPTKTEFRAFSRDELRIQVTSFYGRQQLPVPDDLDALMEDYMCRHLPAGFCNGPTKQPEGDQCLLSWRSIWEGTLTLIRAWLAGNRAQAPMHEIEQRASICVQCPLNAPSVACLACYGIPALFARRMGGRAVSQKDHQLHVCQACCCLLKAKVVLSEEILRTTSPHNYFAGDEQRPPCWMLKLHAKV